MTVLYRAYNAVSIDTSLYKHATPQSQLLSSDLVVMTQQIMVCEQALSPCKISTNLAIISGKSRDFLPSHFCAHRDDNDTLSAQVLALEANLSSLIARVLALPCCQ